MASPGIQEILSVWQPYAESLEDWKALVQDLTPKDTQCGPVYDIIPNPSEVGQRPNEGFAIADMSGVKVAEPHYHANGETEIYIVISGIGKTYVRDRGYDLATGSVVVTPPDTVHYTIPEKELVLAVINTPPFKAENVVELTSSDPVVGFDREVYLANIASI